MVFATYPAEKVYVNRLELSQGDVIVFLTWAALDQLQLLHSEEDLPRIVYVSLAPGLVFVLFVTGPNPTSTARSARWRPADPSFPQS